MRSLLRGYAGTAYNGYDDDFNDPATLTTRWNGVAGNTTCLHKDVNSTTPGCLYLQGQVYMVPPPIPFVMESRATILDWDSGPAVGGVWTNAAAAAPGPYFGAGPDVGTPGGMWLSGSQFDSSGAFAGNVNVHGNCSGYCWDVAHHIRMTVHSATNIDWEISTDDGATWAAVVTGYNPGFAINYVGLESGGCRTSWDWVRFTLL